MPIQLNPFAYDPTSGTWIAELTLHQAGHSTTRGPDAVTIVTWNVWFASYCFEQRFRALLDLVRAQRPDVICLQEILPESLEMLLAEPWIRDAYRVSDASGDSFESYGVVLLSRLPVRALAVHELPSSMGRRLLAAEIDAGPVSLVVSTVHLESMKHNGDVRAEQLEAIFPLLRSAGSAAVLTGDLNFCSSGGAENAALDPEFLDVWSLRGRGPGYTVDTTVNVMLHNQEGREKTKRYDRVLLRPAGSAWRARSIALLGTTPISAASPDVFPSDHFGLVAVIEMDAV